MEIQISIFTFQFLEAEYFSSYLVFSKKFEFEFTLNLKNKFLSENS